MSIEANRARIVATPRSDQFNYEDFLGGPRDFTIERIEDGSANAPYDIYFVGEERAWRPPLTVLRLLMKAWETDERAAWIGRRVRLYGDDTIKIGQSRIGGIRVSHVSHITEAVAPLLSEKRGQRKTHAVQPLPDTPPPTNQPPEPTAEQVAACVDVDELKAMWKQSGPERRKQIEQRVQDLNNEPGEGEQ